MSGFEAVAIVGAAESEVGRLDGRFTEFALHAQAASLAVKDAGLSKDDVDGLFTVTNDWLRSPSQTIAEYLGLRPSYEDSTSTGGSSFEVLVEHAVAALQAHRVNVALITYGSTLLSSSGRTIGTRVRPVSPFAQQYEDTIGLPLVGAYAMAARRHMYEYGTTSEDLAEIAVSARYHAGLNPLAMYRKPLTVDDVLASRVIASPLHKLDCCVVSDGGGAIVLTRGDRARDCAKAPVWVLGSAHSTDHQIISQMPDLTTTRASDTARRAFAEAGIVHSDVSMLMTYDSFTITVLLALEDLGFCKKGEGGKYVRDGRIRLGGDLPVNVDGGGLSSLHPGMRGMFLLTECVRQLRGEGGDRQVADARIAVAHGVGGWLSSCATVVLGLEPRDD